MIRIDPGFQALVPPLTAEELAQLEANILADGCRDPLVTWQGAIIDGHNRYAICTRHGIDFETVEMDFESREAAEDWMDANQLGRRNLTKDQYTLLLGRRYNRTKKAAHRPAKGGQNEPLIPQKTAQKLATEYGVSPATVKRAGQYAEAVETVKQRLPKEILTFSDGRTGIRHPTDNAIIMDKLPRKDVVKAAELIDAASVPGFVFAQG